MQRGMRGDMLATAIEDWRCIDHTVQALLREGGPMNRAYELRCAIFAAVRIVLASSADDADVIVHRKVDLDAALAALMLMTSYFGDQNTALTIRIFFVGAGEVDITAIKSRNPGVLVGDVGGVYRPASGLYDHHGLHGPLAHTESAVNLIARNSRYFSVKFPMPDELIRLVHRGDGAGYHDDEVRESRRSGLHALFNTWRDDQIGDLALVQRLHQLICDMNTRGFAAALDAHRDEIDRQTARFDQLGALAAEVLARPTTWCGTQTVAYCTEEHLHGLSGYLLHELGFAAVLYFPPLKGALPRGLNVQEGLHAGKLVDSFLAFTAKCDGTIDADAALVAVREEILAGKQWYRKLDYWAGRSAKGEAEIPPLQTSLEPLARWIDTNLNHVVKGASDER